MSLNTRSTINPPRLSLLLLIPSLLFVPGLFVVFFLAAALILISAWVIFSLLQNLDFIPVYVVLLIGIGVLIGLLAVADGLYRSVVRPPGFAPSLILDMSREPALSAFISELCEKMGTGRPDFVLLHLLPTFFVTQDKLNTFNGQAAGRILAIGAPVLGDLTYDEFQAVLAHEFAHFTGRDTLYSTVVRPVYISTATACSQMRAVFSGNSLRSLIISLPMIIPYVLLSTYLNVFQLIDSALSRSRETRADIVAVSIAGKQPFSTALTKVAVGNKVLGKMLSPRVPVTIVNGSELNYCDMYHQMAIVPGMDRVELEKEVMATGSSIRDRHPSIKNRLAVLPDIAAPPSQGGLARDLLLNAEDYEQTLTGYISGRNTIVVPAKK